MKLLKISVSVLLFVLITGCKNQERSAEHEGKSETNSEIKISKASALLIGIQTAEIKEEYFTGSIVTPASIRADQDKEAVVGSLIAGRVVKVFAGAGAIVKKNQPLMQVESLEIGEIKAAYINKKARFEYTRTALERIKSLSEKNAVSKKNYLEAQADYERAQAEYTAEDKKIHAVGLTDVDILSENNSMENNHSSGSLIVRSPIDGVITERNVIIGQMIETSFNAFRVINSSTVWAEGSVYEKDIRYLEVGAEASFTLSSDASVSYTCNVVVIGSVVDAQSRTVPFRATLQNKSGKLKPNSFGTIKIINRKTVKGIRIPEGALVKINNEDAVFIEKSDGLYLKRIVKTGVRSDGFIEIKEGLQPGDKIVIAGAFNLKSELKKSELGEGE